jgi:hypothetical protein
MVLSLCPTPGTKEDCYSIYPMTSIMTWESVLLYTVISDRQAGGQMELTVALAIVTPEGTLRMLAVGRDES